MSNYNFRFDLSKLTGFGKTTLTGKSGVPKRCIVIPIEENGIFEGEKGTYLDLVCFETPQSEYSSHLVSISKTKEEMETEKATGQRFIKPIVGNLKPFGGVSPVEEYKSAPAPAATTEADPPAPAPAPKKGKSQSQTVALPENEDPLPF